jgi:hypothetical protein
VEIALLDPAGTSRGSDPGQPTAIQKVWEGPPVRSFSSQTDLSAWEQQWPQNDRRPIVKVIYDRSAREVRVVGRAQGKPFQKTFPVDQKPEAALLQAQSFIREQIGR